MIRFLFLFQTDYLTPAEVEEVTECIIEEAIRERAIPTDSVAEQDPSAGAGTSQATPPPAKKQRTLAYFIASKAKPNRASTSSRPVPPRLKVKKEIEAYTATDSVQMHNEDGDETSPLQWWRDHERDFKTLSGLAKKYLCIQATSSPSERLFSKAGQVITPRRAQLKPEKANMLIFLADNL